MTKKDSNLSLVINVTNGFLKTFEAGLSAWKTYLSTRQEAYERKMDKKKEKAIQLAEEIFYDVDKFIDWVNNNMPMTDDQNKEFKKIEKLFDKKIKKFNKYD
jgi:hypothetical protein